MGRCWPASPAWRRASRPMNSPSGRSSTKSDVIEHVAIIGAGFSGTLQAINLLRHEGPRATLIERAPVAGLGLAYGAAHPSHVLNVRAAN
ncbi:FAD/NAD(P)-binding protein, partial [Klebsiella pneumoniae]|uniref:FAD/NAD(P)-binding protein n=1 Tax=Klebsiella pneumoniae TaxID=573 RepID=UPI0019539744